MDLVRPRSQWLFGVALQILRDIDRAEDALQDALVIAWRDLRGLRDPDRFDAWLRRLLVNVCIREAARQRRRAMNLRVLPVDGPAAPDDLLSLADRDQLERGFRRLPPDQRAILVLASLPGLRPDRDRRDARHPARDRPLPTLQRPSRHAGRPRGRRPIDRRRRTFGMTSERDIERVLDHWFTERPTQVADRVLDEVADRIARQPQQPAWRVSRRDSHVNTNLKALLAVAAIIVVAVAGFAVLRPSSPPASAAPGADRSHHRR